MGFFVFKNKNPVRLNSRLINSNLKLIEFEKQFSGKGLDFNYLCGYVSAIIDGIKLYPSFFSVTRLEKNLQTEPVMKMLVFPEESTDLLRDFILVPGSIFVNNSIEVLNYKKKIKFSQIYGLTELWIKNQLKTQP